MVSSGTQSYSPALSDLTLECFERLQIRASSLTQDQLKSAQRSFNLVLGTWANRGVNLWKQTLIQIPLVQGVSNYPVSAATISVLPEAFIRTYGLTNTTNLAVTGFTATINSTSVQINWPSNGLTVGAYINIVVPVSVGGLNLSGYYQVVSTPDVNDFTITAASAATSGAAGGTVPEFTTTANSTTVVVTLPNHGYVGGQQFSVGVSTAVGGITLSGSYTINSIISANQFNFIVSSPPPLNASVFENSGETQIGTQPPGAYPTDRVLFPLSRAEYTAIPVKTNQAPPTSFWFNLTLAPSITIWPTPDAFGPYQLNYYALEQIQDAALAGGQTPDVPYRAFEALCAGVSAHLAMKFKPELATALKQYADASWREFSDADRERVPFYISGDMQSYFNG